MKINYIEDIKQETINKIVNTHQKETANKHLRNLKSFLNYCIKQKLYKRDDYEAITSPNPKVGIRETTIQEKDYIKIIDSTKDDDFIINTAPSTIIHSGEHDPNVIFKTENPHNYYEDFILIEI